MEVKAIRKPVACKRWRSAVYAKVDLARNKFRPWHASCAEGAIFKAPHRPRGDSALGGCQLPDPRASPSLFDSAPANAEGAIIEAAATHGCGVCLRQIP